MRKSTQGSIHDVVFLAAAVVAVANILHALCSGVSMVHNHADATAVWLAYSLVMELESYGLLHGCVAVPFT